jgi:hypothetical protein
VTVHALNDTKRHDFRLDAYGAFYSPTYAGSRSRVLDAEAQTGATVESPVTSGLRGLNSGGRTDLFRSRKRHALPRPAYGLHIWTRTDAHGHAQMRARPAHSGGVQFRPRFFAGICGARTENGKLLTESFRRHALVSKGGFKGEAQHWP